MFGRGQEALLSLFTLLRSVSAMPATTLSGALFSFSRLLLPLLAGRGAGSAGGLRPRTRGKVGSCSAALVPPSSAATASQCWWPRLAWVTTRDSTAGKLRTWQD